MKAAYAAGADAVYIGGSQFGARAYADNPDDDQLLEAIDYAHIRDKKLYLTVNTLFKERELSQQLYDYLKPLYERGLDAVIVQDLGVMRFIKEQFPKLPLHASTQMTITGAHSARLLEEFGASRVVTARELSLEELRNIRQNTSLEIESFVHGAICYGYSGQCLFSSLAGGRSGNRGRCAQPCRKPYQVYDGTGKLLNPSGDRRYVLSLKDMNTLQLLPQIIEAGVDSLKIEGRMKKPEYTAGVVSIYRTYLDRYLAGMDCTVSPEDEGRLFDLFNRNGFSTGYYTRKNGKEMLTLKEPQFRSRDDAWKQEIHQRFIQKELKRKIKASVMIYQHLPATITMEAGDAVYCLTGEEPLEAKSKPLDEVQLQKQMDKLGAADFEYEQLELDVGPDCFLSVGQMNALRRNAVLGLRQEILSGFFRTAPKRIALPQEETIKRQRKSVYTAQVHTMEQLEAVLAEPFIKTIYMDGNVCGPEAWKEQVERIHAEGMECFYHMPQIFRRAQELYYDRWLEDLRDAGFDGFLLGSLEAAAYVKDRGLGGCLMADHGLYTLNTQAVCQLRTWGITKTTASVELNQQELMEQNLEHSELVGYGYLPMMVTANCVCNTLVGCQKSKHRAEQVFELADEQKRRFPVSVDCENCMNTIYNCAPLYLLDYTKKLEALAPESIRLIFTVEDGQHTGQILRGCRDHAPAPDAITRGHLKRGVE
jgi:putative protease